MKKLENSYEIKISGVWSIDERKKIMVDNFRGTSEVNRKKIEKYKADDGSIPRINLVGVSDCGKSSFVKAVVKKGTIPDGLKMISENVATDTNVSFRLNLRSKDYAKIKVKCLTLEEMKIKIQNILEIAKIQVIEEISELRRRDRNSEIVGEILVDSIKRQYSTIERFLDKPLKDILEISELDKFIELVDSNKEFEIYDIFDGLCESLIMSLLKWTKYLSNNI